MWKRSADQTFDEKQIPWDQILFRSQYKMQNELFINIITVRRDSSRWQHQLKTFAGTWKFENFSDEAARWRRAYIVATKRLNSETWLLKSRSQKSIVTFHNNALANEEKLELSLLPLFTLFYFFLTWNSKFRKKEILK